MINKFFYHYGTMLSLFIVSIMSYFILYFLNVFLARHLTDALYGDFSLGLKALIFASSLILLGTNTSNKKFFQEYLIEHDPTKLRNYLNWNFNFLRNSLFVSILVISIVCVTLFFLHLTKIKALTEHHLAIYLLWIAPVMALSSFISSLYNSNKHYFLSALFQSFMCYFIMFILFIAVSLIFSADFKSIHILSVIFLSFIFLLLMQLWVMQKTSPALFDILYTSLLHKPTFSDKMWRITSLSLLANTVIYQAINMTDLLLIEVIHHNEAAVGWYAAVLTIAGINWIISSSISNYLGPQIMPLLKTNKLRELQEILDHVTRLKMVLLSIATALMLIFSKKILNHFGPTYISAEIPLIIALISSMVSGFFSNSAIVLAYSGNEKTLMNLSVGQFFLLLISGFIGTYFYGLIGLSVAGAMAVLYKLLSCSYYMRKRLGLNPW